MALSTRKMFLAGAVPLCEPAGSEQGTDDEEAVDQHVAGESYRERGGDGGGREVAAEQRQEDEEGEEDEQEEPPYESRNSQGLVEHGGVNDISKSSLDGQQQGNETSDDILDGQQETDAEQQGEQEVVAELQEEAEEQERQQYHQGEEPPRKRRKYAKTKRVTLHGQRDANHSTDNTEELIKEIVSARHAMSAATEQGYFLDAHGCKDKLSQLKEKLYTHRVCMLCWMPVPSPYALHSLLENGTSMHMQ